MSCPTPSGPLNLADSASALNPGTWSLDPISWNANSTRWDISWQNRTAFWDDTHGELHYMGKPQASAGGLVRQAHWIYSDDSDSWRQTSTTVAPDHLGHVWGVTFDHLDDPGDYYFIENDPEPDMERSLRVMDRSVENGAGEANSPWTQLAQSPFDLWSPNQSNIYQPGIGYHPNLLGPGRPGIYGVAVEQHVFFDKVNQEWGRTNVPNSNPYRTRHFCPSVYVPGRDILLFGDGAADNSQYMIIRAGDIDNAAPAIRRGPITIRGNTGNHGKLLIDPRNDGVIMILEAIGGRVWTSDDAGESWTLESYDHPFWNSNPYKLSADAGSWTCASIPRYGCVIAMSSYEGAGGSMLWRPGN